MNCEGCKIIIKSNKYLLCQTCNGKYHYECLNMKEEQYAALTKEFRASWVCPSCTNVTRRNRTYPNTPVRQHQIPRSDISEVSMDMSCDFGDKSDVNESVQPFTEAITVDKFNELLSALNVWRSDMNSNMASIRDDIKNTLSGIQSEIKTIRSEQATMKQEQATLKQNILSMNAEILSLQNSAHFQGDEYSDLKKRVNDISKVSNELNTTCYDKLQSQIDSLEQQARQCNVEVCNLPERRNENLLGIIESICSAIHFQVTQRDIMSVHRVPHAHQGTDKPRNIIVKLSTRIQRDNMLAAFRKVKMLKSEQIGITGTSTTIYINEHLTLQRKQLFRKCRELAKNLNFRFVWIRNATILVREREDSPAIVIKNDRDLEKLRPSKKL